VGISGASCSGKSWLSAKILAQRDGDALIIGLDGYYRDLSDVSLLEFGHDNPASIHADRALADLRKLKSGLAISLPVYNYERQCVVGAQHCESRPLIVVEGLFVFAYPDLRSLFDIKIWIESDDVLRWSRRIDRDTANRELQLEDIQTSYERDVLPGYRKYIEPLREYADLIVSNNVQDATEIPEVARLLNSYIRP
jgi:uridine kinase